jgi:hypothetical protein
MHLRPTLHATLLISVTLAGLIIASSASGPVAMPLTVCAGVLLRAWRRR